MKNYFTLVKTNIIADKYIHVVIKYGDGILYKLYFSYIIQYKYNDYNKLTVINNLL